MKAVIYARYSSASQREESIEVQIRECTAFAEKNGYTVLKHYIDKAISGTTDNRPDFQQMIKDSSSRLFDTVLVLRTDRFSRDVADSAVYKQILKKNGVRVISVTENFGEDAVGQLMGRIMESMAEYYSNELREKVQRGQNVNAEKGIWNGGGIPFGLRVSQDQRLEPDPMTSPFVLEAFKRYDEGATMKEIRDYLNNMGITNGRGLPINYGNIQHLLSNRRYIGEYAYRDYVLPDAITPIVPLDLFERVQKRMVKNQKAPARAKAEDEYLLTTKIFCGNCGAYMCGESGKGRNGTIHRYYKCVTVKKRRGDCKKKAVRKEWIEDLVVNATMRFILDDDAIESIVSMLMRIQDQENTTLPLLEKRLKQTETGINNLLNAIQNGLFTPSTKERLESLEAEKAELEIQIEKERLAKPKISAEFMTFWLHRFRKLDVTQKSHRQMLIDTFVNAIYVYDDKLLLTYNFKEGTDTISLADVKNAAKGKNGSDLDCLGAPSGISEQVFCSEILFFWQNGKNCVCGRQPIILIQVGINISCRSHNWAVRGARSRHLSWILLLFCDARHGDEVTGNEDEVRAQPCQHLRNEDTHAPKNGRQEQHAAGTHEELRDAGHHGQNRIPRALHGRAGDVEDIQHRKAGAHDGEIAVGSLRSLGHLCLSAGDKERNHAPSRKDHHCTNDHRGGNRHSHSTAHTAVDAVELFCTKILTHIGDHGVAVGSGGDLKNAVELVGGGEARNEGHTVTVDH